MSFSNDKIDRPPFSDQGVLKYERRRYRGIDQRIVQAREVRLIDKFFKIVRRAEGREGGDPILDLPCGYGRFTALLQESGRAILNSDLSLEMVRRAGQKSGKPGIVANATQGLPFKTNVFGLVFSIRLFHHVYDPSDREAILREFFRVTSGWAIVSFYRLNGLHLFQRRVRKLFHKSRTKIKMIEPGQFEKEAEAAGFVPVRVLPLLGGLHAYHLALLKKSSLP